MAIYRLNEPGRFPAGYADLFSEYLQAHVNLVLICEVDGEIRGFGGVGITHVSWAVDQASLNYGMVHPDFHQRGFGTTLLLARLAVMPEATFERIVSMTTVGGSHRFYQRFGFGWYRTLTDDRGTEMDHWYTRFRKRDGELCREALAIRKVALETDGLEVPVKAGKMSATTK